MARLRDDAARVRVWRVPVAAAAVAADLFQVPLPTASSETTR